MPKEPTKSAYPALLLVLALLSLPSCGRKREGDVFATSQVANSAKASSSVAGKPDTDVFPCPGRVELRPGLWVEKHPINVKPAMAVPNACLTLVRVDPKQYRPRLFSALRVGGGRRTLPVWAKEQGAVALVNASMYEHDDNSTGLFIAEGEVVRATDNQKFGGYFAFDPVDPAASPVAAYGRECAGFDLDAVRKRYRSIVQNYRLLDCEGRPIPWKDEKAYSAAAFGLDAKDNVVLLFARAPLRMAEFASLIAAPELQLKAAFYVEGGPEASIWASGGGRVIEAFGSYETGFKENDDNAAFWPLPNVLGFVPR